MSVYLEGIEEMAHMNLIKKMAGVVTLVVVFACLTGCETTNTFQEFPPVAGDHTAAPTSDKFNAGDLVIVTFSGVESLITQHEERIKEDGTITLPYIGAVAAVGKSPGDLQKEIRTKYIEGRIYTESLNITVRGQDRFYYVTGEVRQPSRYPYVEGMTVLKAIGSAGDFTDFAKKSKVTVTRLDGRKFKVDCDEALDNPKLDLPVYPGDRVHVPRRLL